MNDKTQLPESDAKLWMEIFHSQEEEDNMEQRSNGTGYCLLAIAFVVMAIIAWAIEYFGLLQ